MTPALASQTRHYAAVRKRLWPTPQLVVSRPKREWTTPAVTPVYATLDERIAAVLCDARVRAHPCARTIIRATAEVFGVTTEDILGPQRTVRCVTPRQIAMAVCAVRLTATQKGLGREFGRDHTCVLHALRKYRERVEAVAGRVK